MADKDIGAQLQAFMRSKGLVQKSLAKKTGTSQASVCRALMTKGGQVGPALTKIFIYSGLSEYLEPGVDDAHERVLQAFDQIWDGTRAHAEWIAKVIGAMANLRPRT